MKITEIVLTPIAFRDPPLLNAAGVHEPSALRTIVEVHTDEMMLIASPRHALAKRPDVSVRDLGSEQFVLHHLCGTTADMVLRLFERHGSRCRIVAELWSFENIKSFVQEQVGLAIVPGVTVRQELRDGALVRIPLRELSIPRRTLMIYREQGYVSDSARELIKLVRNFHWERFETPARPRPRLQAS